MFLSCLLIFFCSCYSEDKSSYADVSAITAALLSSLFDRIFAGWSNALPPLCRSTCLMNQTYCLCNSWCFSPCFSLKILTLETVLLCDTENLAVIYIYIYYFWIRFLYVCTWGIPLDSCLLWDTFVMIIPLKILHAYKMNIRISSELRNGVLHCQQHTTRCVCVCVCTHVFM